MASRTTSSGNARSMSIASSRSATPARSPSATRIPSSRSSFTSGLSTSSTFRRSRKCRALQIEAEVGDIIAEELAKQNEALNQAERKQLVGDILDELLGLGPLEPLLKDPTITDILVNGHDQVFVERYGVLEPSLVRFKDEKHLLRIIQKIVSAVGRRIDESSPMVDARLADGSRVNAVVPPLALDGCLLSIRKFARVPISMDRLVEIGSIPPQVADVLERDRRSRG